MLPRTKEDFITGIRDILTALGVTEICWSEVSTDVCPILQQGHNTDNTYGLDWVEINGVSGSSCWDDATWSWDELPLETIQIIYNELSEYEAE